MMKLLMSWDILAGKEEAYLEFVATEFTPGLMRLGIRPTEVWYTVYGEGPQVLTGGVMENRTDLEEVLESEEWRELKRKLLNYVTDFRHKIVPDTGRFQL